MLPLAQVLSDKPTLPAKACKLTQKEKKSWLKHRGSIKMSASVAVSA